MKSDGGDDDVVEWTVEMKREKRRRWAIMNLGSAIFFFEWAFLGVGDCLKREGFGG